MAQRVVVVDAVVPSQRWPRPSAEGAVAGLVLLGLALRLFFAATTYGTNDIRYWTTFARGALAQGPIDIYSIDFTSPVWDAGTFTTPVYNHGPLTSWLLYGLAHLAQSGVPLALLLRGVASVADVLTAVLVFLLVRRLRGDYEAVAAAGLASLAPVSLTVAGFHGNTDPILVLLSVAAVWLVANRRAGLCAGVAIGLAISVKVVPIVMVPVLAVACWRLGRPVLWRFLAGGSGVFLVLWVPVLVTNREAFVDHVLAYAGGAPPQWGFTELAVVSRMSWTHAAAAGESVRFLVVLVAAGVPALLASARRGRDRLVPLLVTPLPLLLALSTAFGMQYLVWGAAPLLVALPARKALPYVATASVFAVAVYCCWCSAPPWRWDEGEAIPLPAVLAPLMLLTWMALLAGCGQAMFGQEPRADLEDERDRMLTWSTSAPTP
jgi:hypothetical protein